MTQRDQSITLAHYEFEGSARFDDNDEMGGPFITLEPNAGYRDLVWEATTKLGWAPGEICPRMRITFEVLR